MNVVLIPFLRIIFAIRSVTLCMYGSNAVASDKSSTLSAVRVCRGLKARSMSLSE